MRLTQMQLHCWRGHHLNRELHIFSITWLELLKHHGVVEVGAVLHSLWLKRLIHHEVVLYWSRVAISQVRSAWSVTLSFLDNRLLSLLYLHVQKLSNQLHEWLRWVVTIFCMTSSWSISPMICSFSVCICRISESFSSSPSGIASPSSLVVLSHSSSGSG